MTRVPEDLESRLAAVAPGGIDYSEAADVHGTKVVWVALADKDALLPVATVLHELGARLSMTCASQPPAPEEEEAEEPAEGEEAKADEGPRASFGGTVLDGTSYELAYHFDLDGDTVTVIAHVSQGGEIDSLTPLFRTADWSEREMMELYALTVRSHPDPRRLFIDPTIDAAVFERLIPFSTLVNAASTKGLWEKILNKKGGAA
ncbi:NADH-quinone oxidoreductase subunit C [Siculibacillus lacustris]|uniref:NADH-quinone oxidoreductase subunit C n=1 Tax=Siculibacillus lacustris TaxID=1549641 RepID=A0A4Q9VP30_9HYPH|nr:NADH-quinone oxidoreductase subunit C [Siculibacillus lacustris]TBW36627.1 NADH-quinone oxidoreductase subunit C [Siculibacillus lacustris]